MTPWQTGVRLFRLSEKKALTLHNICVMKEQRLPFHGDLFRITLNGGKQSALIERRYLHDQKAFQIESWKA